MFGKVNTEQGRLLIAFHQYLLIPQCKSRRKPDNSCPTPSCEVISLLLKKMEENGEIVQHRYHLELVGPLYNHHY
jgi:hypothetical protein